MNIQGITPVGWGGSGLGTITDVSQVPAGHALTLTITATYATLPGAVRPLSAMSPVSGISATRTVVGTSGGMKE